MVYVCQFSTSTVSANLLTFFKQAVSYPCIFIFICIVIFIPLLHCLCYSYNGRPKTCQPALSCTVVSLLVMLQLPVMTSGLLRSLLDDTSGVAPKVRLLLNCCSLIWLSSLQLKAISALEWRVAQSEVTMSTPAGKHYQVCLKL